MLEKAFATVGPVAKGAFSFIPIAIAAAQCMAVICEYTDAYGMLVYGDPQGDDDNSDDLIKTMIDICQIELLNSTEPAVTATTAAIECLQSLITSIHCSHHIKLASVKGQVFTETEELESLLDDLQREMFGKAEHCMARLGDLQRLMDQEMASEMGSLGQMTALYETVKYRTLARRNYLELLTNLLAPGDDDEDDGEESEEIPDDDDDDDDDDETEAMDSGEQMDSATISSDHLLLLRKFCLKNSPLLRCLLDELAPDTLLEVEESRQVFAKHVYGREIISL